MGSCTPLSPFLGKLGHFKEKVLYYRELSYVQKQKPSSSYKAYPDKQPLAKWSQVPRPFIVSLSAVWQRLGKIPPTAQQKQGRRVAH